MIETSKTPFNDLLETIKNNPEKLSAMTTSVMMGKDIVIKFTIQEVTMLNFLLTHLKQNVKMGPELKRTLDQIHSRVWLSTRDALASGLKEIRETIGPKEKDKETNG